jgi:hypothetical protein
LSEISHLARPLCERNGNAEVYLNVPSGACDQRFDFS